MSVAYSSRVTSTVPFVVAAACLALEWGVGIAAGGSAPVPVLAVASAAVLVAAVHLSTVRLTVGNGALFVADGPWPRPGRCIETTSITTVDPVSCNWRQAFGVGSPWWRWRMSRHTVRSGPALRIELDTRELIYVNVQDAAAAMAVLRADAPTT